MYINLEFYFPKKLSGSANEWDSQAEQWICTYLANWQLPRLLPMIPNSRATLLHGNFLSDLYVNGRKLMISCWVVDRLSSDVCRFFIVIYEKPRAWRLMNHSSFTLSIISKPLSTDIFSSQNQSGPSHSELRIRISASTPAILSRDSFFGPIKIIFRGTAFSYFSYNSLKYLPRKFCWRKGYFRVREKHILPKRWSLVWKVIKLESLLLSAAK